MFKKYVFCKKNCKKTSFCPKEALICPKKVYFVRKSLLKKVFFFKKSTKERSLFCPKKRFYLYEKGLFVRKSSFYKF